MPANFTLGQILDENTRRYRPFGVPETFQCALRHMRVRERIRGQFHEAFGNSRSAMYLANFQPRYHNFSGLKQALFNLEWGLDNIDGQKIEHPYFRIDVGLKPKQEEMPEAVWKYALMYDDVAVARLGLNFHEEEGGVIASISNVQGLSRGKLGRMGEHIERKWSEEAVQLAIKNLPSLVKVVRGIPIDKHRARYSEGLVISSARRLYDRTFLSKHVGMKPIGNPANSDFYEMRRS